MKKTLNETLARTLLIFESHGKHKGPSQCDAFIGFMGKLEVRQPAQYYIERTKVRQDPQRWNA